MKNDETGFDKLSPDEKKKWLYQSQKALLDKFLEKHAISKAQYDKSLKDLTEKMGIQQESGAKH